MPKTTAQKAITVVAVIIGLAAAFFGIRWLVKKLGGSATADIQGDDVIVTGSNGAAPVVLSKSQIWNAAANKAKEMTMSIKINKDINYRLGASDRAGQSNAYMQSNIYPQLKKLVGMPNVKRNAVLAKIDQISADENWKDGQIKVAIEKDVELWTKILAGAIWQVNR